MQSTKDVLDELSLPEDPPARTQELVAAALKQSGQWLSASPATVTAFVRKVVRRVVICPERIEVEVSKRELRAALVGNPLASSPRPMSGPKEEDPGSLISLKLNARVKRCGGEMRLVVPSDPHGQVRSHLVTSLLKALARGHQWYEWVVSGEVSGRRSIAQKLGLDERYVGRVLECAFLAPDIVEAILDGRQPSDLTFKKLSHRLPLSWVEQRELLGFPPLHPRQ